MTFAGGQSTLVPANLSNERECNMNPVLMHDDDQNVAVYNPLCVCNLPNPLPQRDRRCSVPLVRRHAPLVENGRTRSDPRPGAHSDKALQQRIHIARGLGWCGAEWRLDPTIAAVMGRFKGTLRASNGPNTSSA